MENASKALLIAGAILVCILLIGVGMLVFQSIGGTVDESMKQVSAQEKNAFNSQFQSYEGDRVSGSKVRALLNIVRSNNTEINNDDEDPKYVHVDPTNITINTAKTYKVVITDNKGSNDNGDGLLNYIVISEVTAGGSGN